jgi:hypothetical protein
VGYFSGANEFRVCQHCGDKLAISADRSSTLQTNQRKKNNDNNNNNNHNKNYLAGP